MIINVDYMGKRAGFQFEKDPTPLQVLDVMAKSGQFHLQSQLPVYMRNGSTNQKLDMTLSCKDQGVRAGGNLVVFTELVRETLNRRKKLEDGVPGRRKLERA